MRMAASRGRPSYLVKGPELTQARLRRAMGLGEAAEAIGVTRSALSRAETGGPVRLDTLRTVARFYGLDPGTLIVGEAA